MKRLLWVAAVALAGCSTPPTAPDTPAAPPPAAETKGNGQITDYQTPGNLQATAVLGCVPISAVSKQHTPADIYPGMAACIKAGDYPGAMALFSVAGAFGRFDQLRVTDKTAGQATGVLLRSNIADLTQEQRDHFGKVLAATLAKGSPTLAALCSSVDHAGPPAYFPTYMIQHGMGAFNGQGGTGLKANFDAAKAWKESLSAYLHCS